MNFKVSHMLCATLFAVLVLSGIASAADARPKSDDPEIKPSASEKDDERALTIKIPSENISGKVKLITPAQAEAMGDPTVIAQFDTDSEVLWVVPQNETVKAEMKESNGKTLTLKGSKLVGGKMLYVIAIVPQGKANQYAIPSAGGI